MLNPTDIEIMKHQDLLDAAVHQPVEQKPRRRRAHALGAHDRDVEPFGYVRGLEYRIEALFLDE